MVNSGGMGDVLMCVGGVWRRKREKEENKIADGRWTPITRHLGLPLNQTRNMPIQPNIKRVHSLKVRDGSESMKFENQTEP